MWFIVQHLNYFSIQVRQRLTNKGWGYHPSRSSIFSIHLKMLLATIKGKINVEILRLVMGRYEQLTGILEEEMKTLNRGPSEKS
jgi:hypothetical protein